MLTNFENIFNIAHVFAYNSSINRSEIKFFTDLYYIKYDEIKDSL